MSADAIVVGAGLAGLVATAELVDAGKRVILVDQEPEASLGGQAFWSFGGIFLVDSPEQRRMGVKDSYDLAWQDWQGTAGFDRPEDLWPARWAEAYVQWAAGEKRAWMHERGIRFLPNPGWAERGGYDANGHGNSVPRFHVTWGTGPGVIAPFVRTVRDGAARGLVELRFRHRVDALAVTAGAVDGVSRRGARAVAGAAAARRRRARSSASSRFSAPAVIVTSGGIGGNHELVRKNWPARLGVPPERMISGVPEHVDGRMLADRPGRRRAVDQPRPHVALRRGHQELEPDLADARHPDPARAVVAVARRDRPAPAGPAVPRVRHARHARAHHDHRPRPHVVRADAEDHREGVRAVGLRAEPGHHEQVDQGGVQDARGQGRAGAGRRVHEARRGLHRGGLARAARRRDAGARARRRAAVRAGRARGRRARPRDGQHLHQGPAGDRDPRRAASTCPTASRASRRRTACWTRRPGRWSRCGCRS